MRSGLCRMPQNRSTLRNGHEKLPSRVLRDPPGSASNWNWSVYGIVPANDCSSWQKLGFAGMLFRKGILRMRLRPITVCVPGLRL